MDNINTNLSYTGSVDLSININGKKIYLNKKNNGLPNLFRLISKALAGFDISKEKLSYIDLRYSTLENTETYISCLTNIQSLSQLSFNLDNGGWVTRATSTIPYSSLAFPRLDLLDNVNDFRIYLMTKSYDVAFITIDKEVVYKILPGTQALIEWVLKVSNSY